MKKTLIVLITIFLTACSIGISEEIVYNPPIISLIGESEITLFVGEFFDDPGALVILTNDDNEIKTIYTNDNFDSNQPGVYKVNYFYEDNNNQTSEIIERTIIVRFPTRMDLVNLDLLSNNLSLEFDNKIKIYVDKLDLSSVYRGIKISGEYSGFLDFTFEYEDSGLIIFPKQGFRANELYSLVINKDLKSLDFEVDLSSSVRFRFRPTTSAAFYNRELLVEVSNIFSPKLFDSNADGVLELIGTGRVFGDGEVSNATLFTTSIFGDYSQLDINQFGNVLFSLEPEYSISYIGSTQFTDNNITWHLYSKINQVTQSSANTIYIFSEEYGERVLYKSSNVSENISSFILNDVMDINYDGINDFLITERIGPNSDRLLLLKSSGNLIVPEFTSEYIYEGRNIRGEFVDWNGNFDFDIVFISDLGIYLAENSETYYPSTLLLDYGYYNHLNYVFDDFNNNKRIDVASVLNGDLIISYNNLSSIDRKLIKSTAYDVTNNSLASGDLNGDGLPDLILSTQAGLPFMRSIVFQTLNEMDDFGQWRMIYESRGSIHIDSVFGIKSDGTINLISRQSGKLYIR